MAVVGDNPARILSCWLDFIARTDDPTVPARGVGEPIGPTRAGDVLTECQIHEALLNVAFDAQPRRVQLLCPYDTSVLADDVVEEARRSHPFVRVGTAAPDPSADYLGADLVDDLLDRPLPPPPLDAIDLTFTTGSLSSVRREVSAEASRRGLHGSRRLDFELAVAEVAANALLHGGGAGRLQLWGDGTAVVAEVSDRGRFSDLLAGRVRPTADQIGGRGLWIVQQVCDLVQIRSHAGRTAVRLHMRR
jgi:anti-sigma regulatory factor (Ser/Thr protein kinase)